MSSLNNPLSSIIVEHNPQNQKIRHAVIWLHGLGANGNDFVPIIPELKLKETSAVRFIFPNAPLMPITINGGYVMPAWYDIYEMSLDRKVDIDHIKHSSEQINQIIDTQLADGIPSEHIIIAGFSQGGAVAYHNVLTNTRKLGGLLALSTYFATSEYINTPIINRTLPIKIDHGQYDDIVPMVLGQKAVDTLSKLGLTPIFSTYPMAHQVCTQQITDIGQWLNQIFDQDLK